MNHDIKQKKPVQKYSFYDFLPLIIIIGSIIVFIVVSRSFNGWSLKETMLDFMAGFFLVFGVFKAINLQGFVEAYSMYDIIAQRTKIYAYMYPFIEVILGIAYLLRYNLFLVNIITLLVMVIGSVGVIIELRRNRQITCACLGAVFKLPMTYVTLAEDLIMGIMALYMIFF